MAFKVFMSNKSTRNYHRNKKIVKAYKSGKTMPEVAKEFNLTSQAISIILKNGGVKARKPKLKEYKCKFCGKTFNSTQGKSIRFCSKCCKKRLKMWSKKHMLEGCKVCGSNKEPHYTKGMCKKCFYESPETKKMFHDKHIKYYAKNKERLKYMSDRWREENKERFNEYQRNYARRYYVKEKAKKWRDEYYKREDVKERQRIKSRKRYYKNQLAYNMFSQFNRLKKKDELNK